QAEVASRVILHVEKHLPLTNDMNQLIFGRRTLEYKGKSREGPNDENDQNRKTTTMIIINMMMIFNDKIYSDLDCTIRAS
ncbi:hypothetical protein BLOT_003081, partial [Blomia tropicalis]